MRNFTATELDPIIRATDLEKYGHVFGIGDRVRVVETGHTGTIINEKFGKWYIQLDSDKKHVIHANASELVPETFPSTRENAAPMAPLDRAYDFGDRIAKATVDPIFRDGVLAKAESREESDALAKNTSAFNVGDRVRDKWGFVGKITAISKDHADITYENGIEGTVLVGYFKAA